eukprot:2398153-Rhodomonas_salina.1
MTGFSQGTQLLAGLQEVGAMVEGTDGREGGGEGVFVDAELGGKEIVEGWAVEKGLESFLWTHCRDQVLDPEP